jgi:mRNA interferase HigB
MKVHIIKQRTVQKFILVTFGTADLLGKGSNRVIFNIGGNKFRLVAQYYFGNRNTHIFIKWIGIHTAYEKLCKQGEQYTVDEY